MFKIVAKVEGMKCGMCEKHVDEAIKEAFFVKKVNSSHENNETVITSKEDLDLDRIKAVITEAGYTVLDIKKESYKSFFGR